MANAAESGLSILDLENVPETRDDDRPPTSSSAQTATISSTRTSVFDRLYADSRSRKKTEPKAEEQKAKPELKFTSKAVKPSVHPTKNTRKSSNEPSHKQSNELPVESADHPSEVSETPAASNVYERLYRTSTQARKASQKPGADTALNLNPHSEVNRSHLTLAGPRKTRESRITKKLQTSSANDTCNETDTEEAKTSEVTKTPEKTESEELKLDDSSFNFFFGRPTTAVKSARPILRAAQSAKVKKPTKSWRIQRLPIVLVERTSLARGALPILPKPLACVCLVFNIFIPGSGTILSGFFGLCCGAPRFSVRVTSEHRLLALVINVTIGVFQIVTILFCLVGWCWSLGWGIILMKTADRYKRWKRNVKGNMNELQIHEDDDYVATTDPYNIRY